VTALIVVIVFAAVLIVGPIAWQARALLRYTGRHCACDARGLPRPTVYGRHDGSIVVGERGEVLVRPVNGRYLGTQPRRAPYPSAADPMVPLATDDAPPWDTRTAQNPMLRDQPIVPAYAPPVYGEAPQLVVEPGLADRMIA
jgi:hypothetical protein